MEQLTKQSKANRCTRHTSSAVIQPKGSRIISVIFADSFHFILISLLIDNRPIIVIPSPDQFTIAVRCCPLLFELLPLSGKPAIDLPYRMIFAIASKSSVRLYDTQQQMPFAVISNIHYARLTDLSWSSDGTALIVSSFDGFCTLIMFEKGELGKVYEKPIVEPMEVATPDDDPKENIAKNENTTETTSKQATRIETRKQPRDSTSVNHESDSKANASVALDIPETIIATAESFESPEYKGTPATPIAVRREPRTNPATPTTGQSAKATGDTNGDAVTSKRATPIAVRRQPRNILASSGAAAVNQTNMEQDEALDAWPIPIEANNKPVPTIESIKKNGPIAADVEKTEDMRLIYEGDSESNVTKTLSMPSAPDANGLTGGNETPAVSDTNNSKTPRRVQLRTISTPKSKKKLL